MNKNMKYLIYQMLWGFISIVYIAGLFFLLILYDNYSQYIHIDTTSLIFLYFGIPVIIGLIYLIFGIKNYNHPKQHLSVQYRSFLKEYAVNNKPIKCLENNNITLFYDTYENGGITECYIRCTDKKKNIFFTITGDSSYVASIWLIIQSEFRNTFTYNGLKHWYRENEFFSPWNIQLKEENY